MPWFSSRAGVLSGLAVVLVLGVLMLISDSAPPQTKPDGQTRVGGVVWTAPIDVASGNAYRGPWRMNDSDWRFVDDPTVALAKGGTAGVVWADHVEQDLFFQAYGPDGQTQQTAPVNVSKTPDTFSWLPRMVFPTGRPDTVYVLWQEIIFSGGTHGGEVLFARSLDEGRTFSEPINLSQSVAGDGKGRLTEERWHNGSLDLAVGPEGAVYAVWTEYEGRLWLRRSPNGGASFSEPVHVAGTDDRPARGPSLAVAASGTVHVAWTVGEAPTADIQYAHSGETWDAFASPRAVAESDGHSDAPSLAVDAAGTVHLTYGESPSGPFRRYHVRYTQAPAGVDSFETTTVLSDRSSDAYESAHYPDLRVRANGTLHVLWELFPDWTAYPRGLAYVVSRDGGDTFEAPSVVPGSADPAHGFSGSQQGLLMEKLAVNETGNLAVVNSTFDRGEASHIWLYRGRTDGR